MAYKQSIAEIIIEAGKQKKKEDKIKILKKNDSLPLRNILVLTYDENKKFMVPDEAPPYKPSEFPDSQGMLFNNVRVLKYIVEGFSDPSIKQIKREQIFIDLLEKVDKEDAKVLCQMITKKPFKGLSKAVVAEAFEGLL